MLIWAMLIMLCEDIMRSYLQLFSFFRPFGLKSFKFIGDNTGYLHVGPNQLITAQIANHDHFGINVYVHKDSHMSFPPKFTCYDISLTVRFV